MDWNEVADSTTRFMERRREQFIRELYPKALPGNYYWRRIEALQGYDGDWRPEDMDGGDEDPRSDRRAR